MLGTQKSYLSRSVEIGVAAVLVNPSVAQMILCPAPTPAPDQVRVKLKGCGLCGSNLPVWEGRPWFKYPLPPGAPGHEAWGVVDSVGEEVTEFRPGDRVAMLSDHAFAEYDITSESKVVRLPEKFAEVHFPAEPLACAINVIQRCGIRPGKSVAILGIGFLGAVITKLAKLAGASVACISRRSFALKTAISFGADTVFDSADSSKTLNDAVRWNNGQHFDCVIEAAGTQSTLDLAAQLVRERGRLVIAGYHQDGPRTVDMQLWNWRGIDVINAHERDPQVYVNAMQAAVDAIVAGTLDPAPLYTHTFPLGDISKAFEMLRLRPAGFMKALIIP